MPNDPRWPKLRQLLGLSNEELASVDPVVMNLVVATGIPSLAQLNISRYVTLANEWAADLSARMPDLEREFQKNSRRWKDDLDFFGSSPDFGEVV